MIRNTGIVIVSLAALCLSWAALQAADVVYLKDGKKLTGQIVSEDSNTLMFDDGMSRRRITKDQIVTVVRDPNTAPAATRAPAASPSPSPKATPMATPAASPAATPLAKPASTGATVSAKPLTGEARGGYYLIPLEGMVGLEMADAPLKTCMDAARAAGAEVVILQFHSPGGSINSMVDMLKTIQSYDDLRIVAYVKDEAISAAAIMSLGCKEIIVSPRSSIGAAVPWTMGPKGTPANVEEKFQSAFRAECRKCAAWAGHNPLFSDAMMTMDMVLGLEKDANGMQVVEVLKNPAPAGLKIIKNKGKILTMTGQEAVEYGLALGLADSIESCGPLLKIKNWTPTPNNKSAEAFAAWRKTLKDAAAEYDAVMEAIRKAIDQANVTYKRDVWLTLLSQADEKAKRAIAIIKKYPMLELMGPKYSDEHPAALRDEISRARAKSRG